MTDEMVDRLATARETYAGWQERVGRDTWPLAEAFGTEPEASWGPREVLTHVAEMLPFWLGEWERLQAGTGEPVPFGRTADDPLRIGVLARDRTLPLRELFGRIDVGIGRWTARLTEAAGDPASGGKLGRHPRLGEMTADALLERFVVTHLEDHLDQLGAIVVETV